MIMGIAQEDIKKGDVIYLEPENGRVYLATPMNLKANPVVMIPADEIVELGLSPEIESELSTRLDKSFEKFKDENCISGDGHVS